jgi:hypothetical protein
VKGPHTTARITADSEKPTALIDREIRIHSGVVQMGPDSSEKVRRRFF